MKKLYIILSLSIVLLAGCRVARPISRTERVDSITTITVRAVPVVITADSVKGVERLDVFTEAFNKAKPGQVFLTKSNKRVTYSVTKESDSDFAISAYTAQVDTSVSVVDKHTRVNKSVATVTQAPTSGIQKLWTGVKNYVLVSLSLLLLLLFFLRRR